MEELNSDAYKDCFFYNELLNCGKHNKSRKDGLYSEFELDADVSSYLERIHVKAPDRIVTEKELISSRSGKVLPENIKLCAKHRFDFGIYWHAPAVCMHPNHKGNKKKKEKGLRSASWATYELICQHNSSFNFPIGGTVCSQHRDYFLSKDINLIEDSDIEIENPSSDPSFEVPNSLLVETDKKEINSFIQSSVEGVSPIKFQLKSPIEEVSTSTIRYMKRKYSECKKKFKMTLTKKMAPEQECAFKKVVSDSSSNDDSENEDQCLEEIMSAYKSAPSQKIKLALLSLLDPQKYRKSELVEKFECSQRMIRRARELRKQFGPGHVTPENKIIRNRLDMNKVDHFLDFLFTTDTLQDVAYGTTTLKYDCGLKHITPHAVLTALKSHVISDYMEFCKNIEFESLSPSSLLRLLNSFNPSQRKFLSGLDNTTADGLNGFSILCDIVTKLDLSKSEQKSLIESLDLGRRYLKTAYKLYCKTSSICASHCAQFSLSSSFDENFKVACDHVHQVQCVQCNSLLSCLDEISSRVKEMKQCVLKDETNYDFNIASKHVIEYMRHIMRGVQQDKAKTAALEQADEETAFWLQDWSQKILPQYYREKQQDYFGKRGISMHVDVFVTQINEVVEKATYFTILETCDQDALSTLCVSKHTLEQFILDFPHIKKLYVKTDNAGCYAGNVCCESRYLMAKQLGIKILRHDYNEPQRGKDQADRESAVAKMFIRTYLCEGHDVISAKDVYDALIFKGRMKNAKISVIAINKEECSIGNVKIQDIQSYHSVKFEDNEMIFWKYFDIGTGKKVPYTNLNYNCSLGVICPFSSKQKSDKDPNQKSTSLSRKFVNFMFCPENNCTSTFESTDELSFHVAKGVHTIPKLLSVMDRAKNTFAKRMESTIKKTNYQNNSFETTTASCSNEMFSNLTSEKGWALKPKRKVKRLSENQKQFLQECFYKGCKTGNKLTVQSVVKMMRSLVVDGKKQFCPEEYLTQDQVMSYFSRLKGKSKNLDSVRDDENEKDDDLLYATTQENEGDQENFESQNSKDRAWTTDEIRRHSSNWTLAGDVGLFNLLNEFSHQIISRTHEVENAVDSLVHQTKMTSAKINNVINDFHMLSNLQFVENRVYDEEIVEPVSEHKNVPEKTKEQREAEMLPKIIQAIELGLAVLDTAFERINVNEVSDSEDEEDISSEGRTILEPKDPYEHRPLPYIIGTEEFMKCDYAGLKDLVDDDVPSYSEESSLSEMDEASSDEGEQLPLDDNEGAYEKQNKGVFKNISDKISSSDESELFGSEKEVNDFDSESSLEDKPKEKNIQAVLDSAQPVKEHRQNSIASLQSKLKLPQVIPVPPKLEEKKKTDDLFASEELDSDDESPFHKKAGLFTSDIKFGEEKDDDLFGEDLFGKSSSKDVKEVKPVKKAKVSVEKPKSIVSDTKRVPEKKTPSLFDNDDDSEDDIFNTLVKTKKPASIKVGSDESSEKADTSSSPSSAPSTKPSGNAFDFTIGGGNNDSLFADDSDRDDLFSNKKSSRKKLDSLENDDLFGTVGIKAPDKDLKEKLVPVASSVLAPNKNKKGISLFDDDDEDLEEDIFKVSKETKPFKLNENTKPLSLFEDSEEIETKHPEPPRSVVKKETPSLFKDSEQSATKDPDLLRSVEKAEVSSLFGDTEDEGEIFIPSVPKIQQSKLSSIFDDSDNFDLFSPKSSLKEESSQAQSSEVVNTLNSVVDGTLTSTVSSAATSVSAGDTNVNNQVGFDAPVDSSNVLNVISKGRVKVAAKRRKPTRQGRLAALENSKTDSNKTDSEKDSTQKLNQTTSDDSDSLFTEAKSDAKSEFPKLDYKSQEKSKMSLMSQLVSEVSTSKIILKKTAEKEEKDNVDIFSEATKENRSKGSFSFQPPEDKGISSLFPIDNPKDDNDKAKSDSSEDDFFTEPAFKNFRSSISKTEPVLDLDDDEDDDLFSAVKSSVLPKAKTKLSDSELFGDDTDIFADVPKEKYEMFPNQVYEDNDDEDDIFSNISAVSSKVSKTSNSSAVKKVETQQVNIFDDPLTELLKE